MMKEIESSQYCNTQQMIGSMVVKICKDDNKWKENIKKYENIFLDWLSNLCQEMIISQRLPSPQTHTHIHKHTHNTRTQHTHTTHTRTLFTHKLTNLIASLLYRFFIILQPNSQADSDMDRVKNCKFVRINSVFYKSGGGWSIWPL